MKHVRRDLYIFRSCVLDCVPCPFFGIHLHGSRKGKLTLVFFLGNLWKVKGIRFMFYLKRAKSILYILYINSIFILYSSIFYLQSSILGLKNVDAHATAATASCPSSSFRVSASTRRAEPRGSRSHEERSATRTGGASLAVSMVPSHWWSPKSSLDIASIGWVIGTCRYHF